MAALVENLSEPFKPEKYDDTYRKELLDLIQGEGQRQDTRAQGGRRR